MNDFLLKKKERERELDHFVRCFVGYNWFPFSLSKRDWYLWIMFKVCLHNNSEILIQRYAAHNVLNYEDLLRHLSIVSKDCASYLNALRHMVCLLFLFFFSSVFVAFPSTFFPHLFFFFNFNGRLCARWDVSQFSIWYIWAFALFPLLFFLYSVSALTACSLVMRLFYNALLKKKHDENEQQSTLTVFECNKLAWKYLFFFSSALSTTNSILNAHSGEGNRRVTEEWKKY